MFCSIAISLIHPSIHPFIHSFIHSFIIFLSRAIQFCQTTTRTPLLKGNWLLGAAGEAWLANAVSRGTKFGVLPKCSRLSVNDVKCEASRKCLHSYCTTCKEYFLRVDTIMWTPVELDATDEQTHLEGSIMHLSSKHPSSSIIQYAPFKSLCFCGVSSYTSSHPVQCQQNLIVGHSTISLTYTTQ